MSPDEQALLDRPIADLNLSVRARKCMIRLGINTIGELVRRTGDELLECKNFGVTSLNEVREKLTHARPEAARRLTLDWPIVDAIELPCARRRTRPSCVRRMPACLRLRVCCTPTRPAAARAQHVSHAARRRSTCRPSCRSARRGPSKG